MNEYACAEDITECVGANKICDGANDCGYYEDEMGCKIIFSCSGLLLISMLLSTMTLTKTIIIS